MSELKVRPYTMLPSGQCYDRDEADKVIEEQKKQFFELQDTTIKLDKKLTETRKQLCHNKYERCLANAKYWIAVSYQCVDDKHRQRAERHHRKWLELANKFKDKEAK